MTPTHRTKDGREIAICDMEDSHLKNTIAMYIRQAAAAALWLRKVDAGEIQVQPDTVSEILYGSVNLELRCAIAKRVLSRVLVILPPFLMEATIRGSANNYTTDLQKLCGRTGKRQDIAFGYLTEGLRDHGFSSVEEEIAMNPHRNDLGKSDARYEDAGYYPEDDRFPWDTPDK